MSYKGAHYQVATCIHMQEKIKDVLVAAGWTLVGPSTDLVSRQAQDDEHAHILGWFLHSTGESGNEDLHLHLGHGVGNQSLEPCNANFSYLTADVTDPDATTMAVRDGTQFEDGGSFKIGDEFCKIGTVAGNNLTGLTRGAEGTTKATHSTDDVALVLRFGANVTYPYHSMYAFRDLENPIKASTGTATVGLSSVSAVPGYSGWGDGRFEKTGLVKVRGGAEDGKMRFIRDFTDAGNFEYQEFLNAPSTADLDVISSGWFHIPASLIQKRGSSSDIKCGTMIGIKGDVLQDVWIYASKDGFATVMLNGTTYWPHATGRYTPLSAIEKTTMNLIGGGDVPTGTQTVEVVNVDIFIEGGKYRVLSQDYRDWTENQDRSAETSMGANPGDWDDLDPDEIAQENVVIDSIDVGNKRLTFTQPLIYGYRSGAVIGEDPVPIFTHLRGSTYKQFKVNDGASAVPFQAVDKGVVNVSKPSHRRRDRCATYANVSPWLYDGGHDDYNQVERMDLSLILSDSTVVAGNENYSNALPLTPFTVGYYDSYDRTLNNGWPRAHGVCPFVRRMYSDLGGQSEDTIKVMWNGKYETFRIFYDPNAAMWLAVGPEIAL